MSRLSVSFLLLTLVWGFVFSQKANLENDFRISDVSVLLPQSKDHQVEYLIKAFGGCFKWKSRNKEQVSVKPVYDADFDPDSEEEACTTSAVLRPALTVVGSPRTSVQILASDTVTNRVLRCEVFVDQIASVDIVVRTHSLYKDEEQILQVEAKNSDGDTFSSVTGLEFHWEILPENLAQSSTVIQVVPWKESSLDIPEVLKSMEQRGSQTSQILVRGIQTGKTKVVARLIEDGYSNVEATVNLSVLEPLQLNPEESPLYVTPGTHIQYSLESQQTKTDIIKRIPMPNALYQWKSENRTVGGVDETGLFLAEELGRTTVRVEYVNMPDNQASGQVFVVNPGRLKFEISPASGNFGEFVSSYKNKPVPHSNWYLVTDREYFLRIVVYETKGIHEIYYANHLRFNFSLGSDRLSEITKTQNSEFHHVLAVHSGLSTLTAVLEELTNAKTGVSVKLQQPISVSQEVTIVTPVAIVPHDPVVLPWNGSVRHTHELKATGGSGDYQWHSSNSSVATVTTDGIVGSGNLGQTTITVADRRNSDNRDSVPGFVVLPHEIALMTSTREVEVGSTLFLPLLMKDADGNVFDNCSLLTFDWEIESPFETVVFNLASSANPPPLPRGACLQQPFLAVSPGQATVRIRYNEQIATVTIFAFPTLVRVEPVQDPLVTVGSSADFLFYGGPSPWFYDHNSYFQKFEASQPDKVLIKQKPHQPAGVHSYTIVCLDFSEQNLTLTVGNHPSSSNQHPTSQVTVVPFACQPPVAFLLHPARDSSGSDILLLTASTVDGEVRCIEIAPPNPELYIRDKVNLPTHYQIRNNFTLPLNVTLLDEKDRRFTNSSTIVLSWSTDNSELAHFEGPGPLSHNLLNVSIHEGKVRVTAAATGYNQQILSSYGLAVPRHSFANLASAYTFQLLRNVELHPPQASIYYHPQNRFRFTTTAGSGTYHFTAENKTVASLQSARNSAWVDTLPLQEGVTRVLASDVCLGGGVEASSTAIVSRAGSIEILGEDVVSVTGTIDLTVIVRDVFGNPFSVDQYIWMSLTDSVDEPVLRIEPTTKPDVFRVVGLTPGVARITFTVGGPDGRQSSRPHQMYVYAPLKLIPPLVVLVPGAEYQARWVGGPPLRTEISYRIANSDIATVGASGIIHARSYGATVLHASLSGYDAAGNPRTFGSDSIRVKVTPVPVIRIDADSDELYRGEEITVRIADAAHDFPFVFTHIGMNVEWTVVNAGIVSLLPVYQKANISLEEESSFSCRIVGKSVGTTLVTARIRDSNYSPMNGLTAFLRITVSEPLELYTPSHLLLPPNSKYQIRANREDLSYRILWEGTVNSGLSIDRHGLISASAAHGLAVVMISSNSVRRPELRQTFAVVVEVKAVAQLQILPAVPVFKTMPVGTMMRLDINALDERGSRFSTNNGVPLVVHANNLEVATVTLDKSQEYLSVRALKPGHLGIHVSFANLPSIDDLIKINVTQIISPLNPVVHLGGTVQFQSHLKGDYSSGRWTTDNSDILEISESSARARNTGTASVSCNSSDYTSSTYVHVVALSSVQLQYQAEKITNIPNKRGDLKRYEFGLNILDERGEPLVNSEAIDHAIVVRCHIEERAWATAQASYNNKTGLHSCIVTALPSANLITPPESVLLRVLCSDAGGKITVKTEQSIPFVAAFTVATGSQMIFLEPSKPYSLEVSNAPTLTARTSDNRVVVTVQNGFDEWSKTVVLSTSSSSLTGIIVTLSNPETNQQLELTVGTELRKSIEQDTPTGTNSSGNSSLILVGSLLLGFLVIMYSWNGAEAPRPRNTVPSTPASTQGLSPAAQRFFSPASAGRKPLPLPLST